MSKPVPLDIRPLTPVLGAEVLGIDLSASLSQAEIDAIRRALTAHQVIFFRDQKMSFEQHIALGKRFGSLHVHPLAPANHPDHPELLRIHADEHDPNVAPLRLFDDPAQIGGELFNPHAAQAAGRVAGPGHGFGQSSGAR